MKKAFLEIGGVILLMIVITVFFSVVENVKEKETGLEILLENPLRETVIGSPLEIKGKARGTWFFEGDFPVMLTDWDGKIISEGYVTAKGNWMTEEFVQFEGILEFEKPSFGDRGTLILQKDNPSDIPEFDDALEIPIYFE